MTEIIDRADVESILLDRAVRVPEAVDADGSALQRFRAGTSRFVNGAEHEARRAEIGALLTELDTEQLAREAAQRTRWALRDHESGVSRSEGSGRTALLSRYVPIVTLGSALGFSALDTLPALVAAVASAYPTGEAAQPAIVDAAVDELLAAGGELDTTERVLRVQLLVQAYAATATLVERALERAAASPEPEPTLGLLDAVLRDESPVPFTRRVLPDGEHDRPATLRLDGPDRDAHGGRSPRVLAFGAGHRMCPASHIALAIAAAIVETAREDWRTSSAHAHAG